MTAVVGGARVNLSNLRHSKTDFAMSKWPVHCSKATRILFLSNTICDCCLFLGVRGDGVYEAIATRGLILNCWYEMKAAERRSLCTE